MDIPSEKSEGKCIDVWALEAHMAGSVLQLYGQVS